MFGDKGGDTHWYSPIDNERRNQLELNWGTSTQRARKGADNQKDYKNDQQKLGDGGRRARQSEKSHITGDQRENKKSKRPTEHVLAS